jgi:hypothetical protein
MFRRAEKKQQVTSFWIYPDELATMKVFVNKLVVGDLDSTKLLLPLNLNTTHVWSAAD